MDSSASDTGKISRLTAGDTTMQPVEVTPPALSMPPDILHQVCHLAGEGAAPSLLATCTLWNQTLKLQLSDLSPAYLDEPSRLLDNFSAVRTLRAQLSRAALPLRTGSLPLRRPELLVKRFPALTSLDVSRQALPAGVLRDLCASGPAARLQHLRLSGCRLSATDLQSVLLCSGLRSLDLSGVQVLAATPADSAAGAAVARAAAALAAAPALTALAEGSAAEDEDEFWEAQTREWCLRRPHSAALSRLLLSVSGLGQLATLFLDAAPLSTVLTRYHGLCMLNNVSHLVRLPHLTSLSMADQPLSRGDLAALGGMGSQLRDLTLAWQLTDSYSVFPDLPAWSGSVAQLTRLQALNLTLVPSESAAASREALSLAPLTQLTKLVITGCTNMSLALSVAGLSRLQALALHKASPQGVTPELVVHLLAQLTDLTSLDVSFTDSRFVAQSHAAGDIVVHGAANVGSGRLTSLALNLPLHGWGFSGVTPLAAATGAMGEATGLAQLEELTLCGKHLLGSKYHDLALLTGLRALTLTSVPVERFVRASTLKCYLELSALTALSRLTMSGEPRARQPPAAAGNPLAAWFNQLPVLHPAHVPAGDDAGDGDAGEAPGRELRTGPPREPHMQFVATLRNLQVLELLCIESSGVCFSYLGGLRLRTLHLDGYLRFTQVGVGHLSRCRQENLRSLRLATCHWEAPPRSGAAGVADGASTSAGSSSGSLRPAPPSWPSGVCDLLRAVTHAMPHLQAFDVGECDGLTAAALRGTAAALPSLRCLVLRQQPLPLEECAAALAPCTHLKYFEAIQAPPAAAASTGAIAVVQQVLGALRGGGGGGGGRGDPGPFVLTRVRGQMLPL